MSSASASRRFAAKAPQHPERERMRGWSAMASIARAAAPAAQPSSSA